MAGNTLNSSSALQCPHGGTVSIVPSNLRARADGSFIATVADGFTIDGCPFQLPTTPPTPSPCVLVAWQVTDLRVKAGAPTLSKSSMGMCMSAMGLPQGTVIIAEVQTKVSSQ